MENRRNFLKTMAALSASVAVPIPLGYGCSSAGEDQFGKILPLRKLGTTGEQVTMLGAGGYHVGWTTEEDAREVIEAAISGGIRFFDTAHNYANGRSEERYGKYLVPQYRDAIFLMTKTQAATGKELLEEVDLSLSRLKTDHVDLLQLHSLRDPADTEARINNGVIDAIKSIKESGKARYIGFTGHSNPEAHLKMMEVNPDLKAFSTIQMPLNAIDFSSDHSFVREALPMALDKELGILAMKTLADGRFFRKKQQIDNVKWTTESPAIPDFFSVKDALYFAWSLPISTLITGAENKELLLEKIALATEFVNLSKEEKEQIIEKSLSVPDRVQIEYYKRNIS